MSTEICLGTEKTHHTMKDTARLSSLFVPSQHRKWTWRDLNPRPKYPPPPFYHHSQWINIPSAAPSLTP